MNFLNGEDHFSSSSLSLSDGTGGFVNGPLINGRREHFLNSILNLLNRVRRRSSTKEAQELKNKFLHMVECIFFRFR